MKSRGISWQGNPRVEEERAAGPEKRPSWTGSVRLQMALDDGNAGTAARRKLEKRGSDTQSQATIEQKLRSGASEDAQEDAPALNQETKSDPEPPIFGTLDRIPVLIPGLAAGPETD